MDPVLTKTYPDLPTDRAEIMRYAGVGRGGEAPPLLAECLAESENAGPGRVCYRRFPVRRAGEALDLGFARTDSKGLARNLSGCGELVLFAATAGVAFDRMITRYARLSPARALLFDAIGAARIETLCDAFCSDLAAELRRPLRPRYSPGYGDLPLALQKEIVAVLDCPRKIGLTLNESLIMSPAKSVTAIVGVGPGCGDPPRTGCGSCEKENCEYRNEA